MTNAKLDQEIEAKAPDLLSTANLLMLGFATGRTPNSYQELFEALLDRKLTVDEELFLERLEAEQYCLIENIIGPLEVEAEVA